MPNSKPTYEELIIENEKLRKLVSEKMDIDTSLINSSTILQNEDALKDIKLEAALENMIKPILITDKEGNFINFNTAFSKFHRYKSKEECAKTINEFFGLFEVFLPNGEALSLEEWPVVRALRGETAKNAEYLLKRIDTGEKWPCTYSYAPIVDEEGHITGSVVSCEDISKQKDKELEIIAAKNKAEENENNLKRGEQIACMGNWKLDVETLKVSASEELLNIFEINLKELTFNTFIDILHPDDRAFNQKHINDGIEFGTAWDMELRLLFKDGRVKWISCIAEPQMNENKTVSTIAGIVQDITERKEAEEKLKENEDKHRIILETAISGFWITSKHGELLEVNDAYCHMSGYSHDELLNMNVSHVENLDSPSVIKNRIRKITKNGSDRFETKHRRKDGSVFDAEINIQYQPFDGGRFVCFINDISERKQAKEKLSESEEKFRALYDNAPLSFQSLNEDGTFKDVNPAWLNTLGYKREEVIDHSFFDFLHPESRIKAEYDIFPKFKSCGLIKGVEFKIRHKTGYYLDISYEGCVGYHPDGNFKQTYCVFADITERKKTEQDLFESQNNLAAVFNNTKNAQLLSNYIGENDFIITAANNSYIEKINKFGIKITEEDIVGISLKELIFDKLGLSQDVYDYTIAFYLKVIETQSQVNNNEFLVLNKDNYYSETSYTPIFNSENGMSFVLYNSHDITEQRLAEEALLQSEEKFRSIYEQSPIAIEIYDVNGNLIDVNRQTLNMFGVEDKKYVLGFNLWEDPNLSSEKMNTLKNGKSISISSEFDFEIVKTNKLYPTSRSGIMNMDMYASPLMEKNEVTGYLVQIIEVTDRKKVEKKLIKSEDRFRKLINNMPSGVAIYKAVDNDFEFIELNKKAEEIIKTSKNEVIGHTLLETLPNMKNGPFVNSLKKVSNDGITINLPPFFYKDDQRQGWRENSIYKLESGEIVAIFNDVTDLKVAEEQLKKQNIKLQEAKVKVEESNDRFNLAMNATKDGIFDWNLVTNEIYYSPNWKLMLGYEDHELPNDFSIWGNLTKAEDIKESWELQNELINKHRDRFEMELKMKHKNGHWISILSRANAIFDESGKAIRIVGNHTDITERKQAEQAIHLSNKKYKDLFNNSPIPLWQEDFTDLFSYLLKLKERGHKDLRIYFDNNPDELMTCARMVKILDVNQAAVDLHLAESKEQLIGNLSAIFTENSFTIFKEELLALIEGKEIFESESEVKTLLGDLKDIYITLKIDQSQPDKVRGLLATSDITDRKQIEHELLYQKEKAEESDRLKSAFLANMSHEIRTPMNGIMGFAELLKESELSVDQQKNYIDIIKESGTRMLNIINDIIDISKIEASLMKTDIQESNVNNQIEYIYTFFKPEVEIKGMKLIFNTTLPLKEAVIKTDREKVFAILSNLVKNAVKYSNKGSIEFGYYKKGAFLEFYVKDTGIGIPKNRIEAIFERFIQADIEDEMALQGAGLGLSITKSYVEMLGGNIWVESEEGLGSTFYFTLPYQAEKNEKDLIDNEISLDGAGNNMTPETIDLKILIAEDDEISTTLLTITIEKFSSKIITATNGFEAIEACRNNPDIDLILMDIKMPKMDGYKATKQIRQFNKDVIIIAQTAYGLTGDKEKALEAGCNDYIAKPVNTNTLLTLIKKHF